MYDFMCKMIYLTHIFQVHNPFLCILPQLCYLALSLHIYIYCNLKKGGDNKKVVRTPCPIIIWKDLGHDNWKIIIHEGSLTNLHVYCGTLPYVFVPFVRTRTCSSWMNIMLWVLCSPVSSRLGEAPIVISVTLSWRTKHHLTLSCHSSSRPFLLHCPFGFCQRASHSMASLFFPWFSSRHVPGK